MDVGIQAGCGIRWGMGISVSNVRMLRAAWLRSSIPTFVHSHRCCTCPGRILGGRGAEASEWSSGASILILPPSPSSRNV
jgi:hypothetical protein